MVSPFKKIRLIVIAGAALVVAAIFTIDAVRKPEPRYQGRALHLWLAELDITTSNPHGHPDAAAQAIKAIGTNAFPWLERMLRTKETLWREAVLAFNAEQHVVRLPVTPAHITRAQAVDGYGVLGPIAVDDVPCLIELLQDERSPQVRAAVAAALGRIGSPAKAAIPELLKATLDPNAEVRNNALIAVANIRIWNTDVLWETPR